MKIFNFRLIIILIFFNSLYGIKTVSLNKQDIFKLILNESLDVFVEHINKYPQNINKRYKNNTVLMYSILKNRLDIATYLLDNNYINDINEQNSKGMNALMIAANLGYLNIVKLLVRSNANLQDKDTQGISPLIFAVIANRLEVVKYLLSNNVNINDNDNDGKFTPLMVACQKGFFEEAEYLISKGAKINKKNIRGFTALMDSVINGHIEIVKILLSNHANIDDKNSNGFTALMLAVENYDIDIITYLIRNNANINQQSNGGETALSILSVEKCKRLLKVIYSILEIYRDIVQKVDFNVLSSEQKSDIGILKICMQYSHLTENLPTKPSKKYYAKL